MSSILLVSDEVKKIDLFQYEHGSLPVFPGSVESYRCKWGVGRMGPLKIVEDHDQQKKTREDREFVAGMQISRRNTE